MDWRKGGLLGVSLLIGGIGCKSWSTGQTELSEATGQKATMQVTKEKDLPKRPPHPATLVAYGEFQEREAADPARTAVEKEQLLDRARRSYQQALELEPTNLTALKALAHLYTILPDHDRAIATYERAIQAYPKDASISFALGVYQGQCKEWEPAADNLRHACTLEPENRMYGNWLGYCLARAGHYEESIACFQQIVGPAQAHYNVARMQLHMQQDEAAKQNLRVALQADPQHKDARLLLSQLEGAGIQQIGLQVPVAPPAVKVGFED